jgi:hypothetical protein
MWSGASLSLNGGEFERGCWHLTTSKGGHIVPAVPEYCIYVEVQFIWEIQDQNITKVVDVYLEGEGPVPQWLAFISVSPTQ